MTTEKEEAAPTGIEAAHFKEANQKTKPPEYITKDAEQIAEMAIAVAPGGELHAFLPERPDWYQLVGAKVHGHLAAKRALIKTDPAPARHGVHPRDLERLKFVHRLASARRRGAEIGPAYAGPTQGSVEGRLGRARRHPGGAYHRVSPRKTCRRRRAGLDRLRLLVL